MSTGAATAASDGDAHAQPESSIQRATRLQEEFEALCSRVQELAQKEQSAAEGQAADAPMTEERNAQRAKLAAARQKLQSLMDAFHMWESCK